MKIRSVLLLALTVTLYAEYSGGEDFSADPGNYRRIISILEPGDTASLAAGIYTNDIIIGSMHGTESEPITITGPKRGAPAVFLASSTSNTVQLVNSSYVIVRHLTLDGHGLSAPFGVDARGITHHITVEYLTIIGYSGSQATVGISTKGPAWHWTIGHNTIVGAGTGMYLGNSDGNSPFIAGLIEHNLIMDTIGYNVEIKHQNIRPTDIGLPEGIGKTTIRHNVFSKLNNASSGINSRPNLLVGHLPLSGDGSEDVYEIYGNFFYQNPGDALFQGEGNIAIYNNLLVNDSGSGINIQPHNDLPKMIRVFNNIIVAFSAGIKVSTGDTRFLQLVTANAVFAENPINATSRSNNVTGNYVSADDYLNDPFGGLGRLDLYPATGRLSGPPIDSSAFNSFADWNLDFNGEKHDGTYRGAYAGQGSNSGWRLGLAIKPAISDPDRGGFCEPIAPEPTILPWAIHRNHISSH